MYVPPKLGCAVYVQVINSQSVATASPHVQLVQIPQSAISQFCGPVASSIATTSLVLHAMFYDGVSNQALPSWYEGFDGSNHYWFVRIATSIVAGAVYPLWLYIYPQQVINGTTVGVNAYYAQHVLGQSYGWNDNGANTFYLYWNFQGTTLPPGVISYVYPSCSLTVNNGATMSAYNGWVFIYSSSIVAVSNLSQLVNYGFAVRTLFMDTAVTPPPNTKSTTVGLYPINVTSQVTTLGNTPWMTGSGNLGFGGFIYAAYLFNRVLTSSDILAIVANPWSPNVTGIVAMYIPSPQYFTGNVTQVSAYEYIIGSGSTWIDASGNGNNLTVVGTIYLISTSFPWIADMRQGAAYMSYVPTSLWYSNSKTAAAIVIWIVTNFNSGWEDIIWYMGATGGACPSGLTFRVAIGEGVSCCNTGALCYDESCGCSSGANPIYPPVGLPFFAASMWYTTGYIGYSTYQGNDRKIFLGYGVTNSSATLDNGYGYYVMDFFGGGNTYSYIADANNGWYTLASTLDSDTLNTPMIGYAVWYGSSIMWWRYNYSNYGLLKSLSTQTTLFSPQKVNEIGLSIQSYTTSYATVTYYTVAVFDAPPNGVMPAVTTLYGYAYPLSVGAF